MKYLLFLGLFLFPNHSSGQPWYSKMYNITGGQEVAKSMAIEGDTVYIRSTFVCEDNLCTILGIFSHLNNQFLENRDHNDVQTGLKNLILSDDNVFLSSEERNLNEIITISKFNNTSLERVDYMDLSVDSSRYFSYAIGPAIRFYDKLIASANVLDSMVFIGYQGWNNYQEKAVLFRMNLDLHLDTFLIISPSSGAFLKIEDMAIGPDSILYISFYEKYLKQGNPNKYLEIRKVIYGYDQKLEKVFQWIGPDFDVPESITCISIGDDSTIYFNYKHDFKTYIGALEIDGSLKWETLLDSNPGANLYNIRRIIKAQNGDIIGTGTISSVIDELGQSGFIFRIDHDGHLLWKRAIRINKGMDLILPPEFPFQSNFEDIVELSNGDLLATGFVNKYVGEDDPEGPYNSDIWIVRTNNDGCLWPECSYIQDIVSKDQYIRIVTSLNEWVVDIDTTFPPTINRYTFDPDSALINDRYYYELLLSATIQPQWQGTDRFMREDSGKVYELDENRITETLLYDFNFQTGDTIPFHQDGSVNNRQVVNVGTIKLWDDVIRKTISISCASSIADPDTTTWIEGIGDIERLFWSQTYCAEEDVNAIHRNIRCFFTNKQVIYSRPDLEDCYITGIAEPTFDMVRINPNPSFDFIHLDIPEDKLPKSVLIINVLGQKFTDFELLQNNALDVSKLNSGLYFGFIHFYNGSPKIFRWCKL